MRTLLFGVLLLWSQWLPANVLQIPWPRPLGLADGLSTSDIRAVDEDATGYLWLASGDGLLRFDGQRFRTLRAEAGLPDLDLRDLHVDARDRIWLATATQGVVMLGVDRSTFERAAASAPTAVRRGHVRQVISGREGRIWVIGDDLRVYVRAAEHPVWQLQPLGGEAALRLLVDREGRLWAASRTRLWRWDDERFAHVPLPTSAPLRGVWADPRGGVEVSTAQHTWVLDRSGRVQAGPRQARTLLRDRDGVAWQQTGASLQWQRDGQSRAPVMRPPVIGADEDVQVRQILQDRQGDLWWVSERHGLWWLPSQWHRFTALPAARGDSTAPQVHPVLGLAASGTHHVWVARIDGALHRLDLRSGRVTHQVAHSPPTRRPAPAGLAEDRQGRVWLASAGRLTRYDPGPGQITHWPLVGEVATTASPVSLQVCANDQVWVARGDGLQRWSTAGERLRQASAEQLGWSTGVRARQLLCTPNGDVWATDPGGLLRWSAARERFQRVNGDTGGAVTALAAATDGSLWVARHGALEHFRVAADAVQRLRHVGSADGYPHLQADALALDAQGVVWAGTRRGIVRIAAQPQQVTLFGVAQGLPAQEVLWQRLVRLGSGAVVAAVREGGLLAFDPAVLPLPSSVPVLVVDAMTRRRHGRMLAVPLTGEPVQLNTLDRNVRVAVSLLGRGDPDRTRHRFRLLGQDAGWIDTGPVAQRIFERLPAGEHVLLVQARHAEGPWSAVRELHLRVVPQWWQTPGGRVLLGISACAGIIVVARAIQWRQRYRERRRQARGEGDQAETDSLQRTRFLVRLGRQIRMPMTPVLGWSELLLASSLSPTQRTQVGSLHQAGHHLVQLMDDALDLASVEADRLQLIRAPFPLQSLLDELHALLLPVAQGKSIALHWSSTLEADAWYFGDVQRLRQILLNLLGNAVKFTARGQVSLQAGTAHDASELVLVVADTGPGMTARQVRQLFQRFSQADGAQTLAQYGGSGLGLAISRDLAQAMGGRIEVESQPGCGTRLSVHLPWRRVAAHAPVAMQSTTPVARSLRVMVLLPSASVTDVVCALLRAYGHRVVGVDDIESWMTHVDPGPWDLIAADPDMLVGSDRASARLPWLWPGVPRLALSARADPCAERDALAAGFNLFLRLPMTGAQLQAALARCRVSA